MTEDEAAAVAAALTALAAPAPREERTPQSRWIAAARSEAVLRDAVLRDAVLRDADFVGSSG